MREREEGADAGQTGRDQRPIGEELNALFGAPQEADGETGQDDDEGGARRRFRREQCIDGWWRRW